MAHSSSPITIVTRSMWYTSIWGQFISVYMLSGMCKHYSQSNSYRRRSGNSSPNSSLRYMYHG
jgi:hypothetical protein